MTIIHLKVENIIRDYVSVSLIYLLSDLLKWMCFIELAESLTALK